MDVDVVRPSSRSRTELSIHNPNLSAILLGWFPCCFFLALYATSNVECGPNEQAEEYVISMHFVTID